MAKKKEETKSTVKKAATKKKKVEVVEKVEVESTSEETVAEPVDELVEIVEAIEEVQEEVKEEPQIEQLEPILEEQRPLADTFSMADVEKDLKKLNKEIAATSSKAESKPAREVKKAEENKKRPLNEWLLRKRNWSWNGMIFEW